MKYLQDLESHTVQIFQNADPIHPEAVEMDILTVDHAEHHPAESFEVTSISRLNLALTQKLGEGIIKTGSRRHRLN